MDIETFKGAFMKGRVLSTHLERSIDRTRAALGQARGVVDGIGDAVSRCTLDNELRGLVGALEVVIEQSGRSPRAALESLVGLRTQVAALEQRARTAAEVIALPLPGDRQARSTRIEEWLAQLQPQVTLALEQAWHFALPELRTVRGKFQTEWGGEGEADLDKAEGFLARLERLARGILDDKLERDAQIRRVRTWEERLEHRVESIDEAIEAKDLGDPPVGELATALESYVAARGKWKETVGREAWYEAEGHLIDLAEAVSAVIALRESALGLAPLEAPLGSDDQQRVELARLRRLFLDKEAETRVDANRIDFAMNRTKMDDLGQLAVDFKKIRGTLTRYVLFGKPPDYAAGLEALERLAPLIPPLLERIGDRIDEAPVAPVVTVGSLEDLEKRRKALEAITKELNKASRCELRTLAADPIATWVLARDGAVTRIRVARRAKDAPPYQAALDDLEQAQKTLRAALELASKARISEYLDEELSPRELRARITPLVTLAPDSIRELSDDQLDAVVASCGTRLNKSQKALVAAAMKARYGLDSLEGTLSSKALPRLYKVFGMVPEDHAKNNDKLKNVVRHRPKIAESSSFYRGGDEPLVFLSLQRTGLRGTLTFQRNETLDQDPDVDPEFRIASKTVRRFDAVTLHEIGHAVDDNVSFMDKNGGKPEYGGWQEHKPLQLADIIGEQKSFYGDFGAVPRQVLRTYLLLLLKGKKPLEAQQKLSAGESATLLGSELTDRDTLLADPGLQQAEVDRIQMGLDGWDGDHANAVISACQKLIALPHAEKMLAQTILASMLPLSQEHSKSLAEAVDHHLGSLSATTLVKAEEGTPWDDMAQHQAATFAQAIRMRGESSGLWDKKASGARLGTLGERVYQQAYDTQWYSYAASARKQGVSSYQFRADGEWFAEVYSTYFLDKLVQAHPLYAWLEGQDAPE